jgi:hypothetical protein
MCLAFRLAPGWSKRCSPPRTLLIDALTFLASAYLMAKGVPRHQTPQAGAAARLPGRARR